MSSLGRDSGRPQGRPLHRPDSANEESRRRSPGQGWYRVKAPGPVAKPDAGTFLSVTSGLSIQ